MKLLSWILAGLLVAGCALWWLADGVEVAVTDPDGRARLVLASPPESITFERAG